MDSALIIPSKVMPNLTKGVLTGKQFENLLEQYPDILQHLKLQHPKNKKPFIYVPEHGSNGNYRTINAHFAYARGFAPKQDHIFKKNSRYKNITEAVVGGAKILLSLNLDTSYLSLDFSASTDSSIKSESKWKFDNENYYSVSVKSIQNVIYAVNKVHAVGGDLSKDIFSLYRNAVMPYREFYLGKRETDILQLYTGMEDRNSGITIGSTRSIGFPRMFRLTAAKSTIYENGVKGIKSAPLKNESKAIYNHLIASPENSADKSKVLKEAWAKVCEGYGEIYVVGSPTITLSEDKNHGIGQLRWIMGNSEKQIASVQNDGIRAVAERRFTEIQASI